MRRRIGVLSVLLLLASCRSYDFRSRITDDDGLIPGDQFAQYGREQAQAVAIARHLAQAGGPEAAVSYARGLPDVVSVVADTQANWLTLTFRSGWRTAVTPLADGKSAAETPNLPK